MTVKKNDPYLTTFFVENNDTKKSKKYVFSVDQRSQFIQALKRNINKA